MNLTRPGKENKQPVKVNRVIEDTISLLGGRLKKERIIADLDLNTEISDIIVSPGQLGQVFMNLINNSIEAIGGVSRPGAGWIERTPKGGKIIISTSADKNNIVINFADSGPGISDDDLEHIFDPFYTRKKTVGMGIGLSICSGIIEDHNGTIEAGNTPEGGAIFTIKLPV